MCRASGREMRLPASRDRAKLMLRRLVFLTAQLSVTRVVFGHGDAIIYYITCSSPVLYPLRPSLTLTFHQSGGLGSKVQIRSDGGGTCH